MPVPWDEQEYNGGQYKNPAEDKKRQREGHVRGDVQKGGASSKTNCHFQVVATSRKNEAGQEARGKAWLQKSSGSQADEEQADEPDDDDGGNERQSFHAAEGGRTATGGY